MYIAKIKRDKSKNKTTARKMSKHLEFWICAENFIIIVFNPASTIR